jgi:hypothetical protein
MYKRSAAAQFLGAICALSFIVSASFARPRIDMGLKDDAAFSQPIVEFELFDLIGTSGKGPSLGPDGDPDILFFPNQLILDTGATSIIVMNDAESSLQSNGYVTVNQVEEHGVAGSEPVDVSDDYYIEVTDAAGNVTPLPGTRILSGQFPDLVGINGIVGMPAMVGKVVTLDLTDWSNIGPVEDIDDLLEALEALSAVDVQLNNSLPTSNGHRYSVPIRAQSFPLSDPGVLPTSAPLPMLEMSVGFRNQNASGNFVLDTGAAISFISTDLAVRLGLDTNDDGLLDENDDQYFDTLPIGGIGGIFPAPEFLIDRISLTTEQGVDLVWQGDSAITVLVVDIDESIDGVLGSDILTSGWITFTDDLDIEITDGPIVKSHFDFRNFDQDGDLGRIYFDITPSIDVVQTSLPGDYNDNGIVDTADYSVWRNSMNESGSNLAADGDGNGSIGSGDFLVWKSHFGESLSLGSAGSVAVPETSSFIVSAIAAIAGLLGPFRAHRCFAVERLRAGELWHD